MPLQNVYLWIALLQIIPAGPLGVNAAGFNESVSCEDFPEVADLSLTELQLQANMSGQCVFYTSNSDGVLDNPCNDFYRPNVDKFYLPSGRANDSVEVLNTFAESAAVLKDLIVPPCRDPAIRAVCYHYYPPCGNVTHFEPPNALCQDICDYVTETVCMQTFLLAVEQFKNRPDLIAMNLQFINCSRPGFALGSLPHCCSDAGIRMATSSTNPTSFDTTSSNPTRSSTVITAASVVAALAVVLVVAIGTILIIIFCVVKKPCKREKIVLQFSNEALQSPKIPGVQVHMDIPHPAIKHTYVESAETNLNPISRGGQVVKVPSKYVRRMSKSNLLIPNDLIQLRETVGKGEFGVVYRGYVTNWQGEATRLVAIKTLKDCFSVNDVDDLMSESEKMRNFSHPNILSLIGVCIDAGEAPYIVMPFMSNGSLLTYLRKERPHFTIADEAEQETIDEAQRKLLSMCHQVAKGMSYLAEQKFVHRDLAARNCMIDETFTLKVADFGLTEDIYCTNYFRQGQGSDGEEISKVKLPIKWMALECLLDGIFSEKTDVWSYGVTCWEIFSLGHTPYPGISPFSLVKFLQGGERLEKPTNAACTDKIYDMIAECMNESPEKRPSFSDLVTKMDSFLQGVAGYLDFSAFPPMHQSDIDHLES